MKAYVVSTCDISTIPYIKVNKEGKNISYDKYIYKWKVDSVFLDKDKAFEYCEELAEDFDFFDPTPNIIAEFDGWSEEDKSGSWYYTNARLDILIFLEIKEFEISE